MIFKGDKKFKKHKFQGLKVDIVRTHSLLWAYLPHVSSPSFVGAHYYSCIAWKSLLPTQNGGSGRARKQARIPAARKEGSWANTWFASTARKSRQCKNLRNPVFVVGRMSFTPLHQMHSTASSVLLINRRGVLASGPRVWYIFRTNKILSPMSIQARSAWACSSSSRQRSRWSGENFICENKWTDEMELEHWRHHTNIELELRRKFLRMWWNYTQHSCSPT